MPMPQVLVREVETTVLERLKQRAKEHGRSLEAELRLILKEASEEQAVDMREEARRVRAMFAGRHFSDSAELIREDRER